MFDPTNLHLMFSSPAGKVWMYDAKTDFDIHQRYFDSANKLSAGDFVTTTRKK